MTSELLSDLVACRLEESRPRQLARKSQLISDAATTFRKIVSRLKAKVRVEHVSLNKLAAKRIASDGRMITGVCLFHTILSSPSHGRRVGVDILIPVIAGSPTEPAFLITAAGRKLPLTDAALKELLRARPIRSGKQRTPVMRAYYNER